jgi:hypothetical protein
MYTFSPAYLPAIRHSQIRSSTLKAISSQLKKKTKGIPQQAEVALGVPGSLRPWIFSTFSTTRVVCRQPNAPAAFTPGEIPGTHFQRLSRPQGTWFCLKEPRKKSQVTPEPEDTVNSSVNTAGLRPSFSHTESGANTVTFHWRCSICIYLSICMSDTSFWNILSSRL